TAIHERIDRPQEDHTSDSYERLLHAKTTRANFRTCPASSLETFHPPSPVIGENGGGHAVLCAARINPLKHFVLNLCEQPFLLRRWSLLVASDEHGISRGAVILSCGVRILLGELPKRLHD